jgi:hypothetical protein
MWSTPDDDKALLDADCSPTKTCRNMVGITFDGFAEEGGDLAAAWRTTLEAEGKLTSSGESLRDLVLGDNSS